MTSPACILRNCHCKIVLPEPENFDSHEIAMSSSRQTFRMKLPSVDKDGKDDIWKRGRVSKEKGIATKNSQRRVKKTWTLQMLKTAGFKEPPAFNNIYNEKDPPTF